MSVKLSVAINTAEVLKKITNVQRSIPKVTSRAMQLASEQARDDARKSAERRLDRPRPQTLKAIRNRYPNRGQVIGGKANAAVYIQPFLVDEIHSTVYGGRQDKVPDTARGVISPTRALRTNKYGNIRGLRNRALQRLKNKKNYLDVPLGNRDRRTLHLPPGLYKITGRRRRQKLVMVVSYNRSRRILDPVWAEYPKIVRKSFDKHYVELFKKGLLREIGKQI